MTKVECGNDGGERGKCEVGDVLMDLGDGSVNRHHFQALTLRTVA